MAHLKKLEEQKAEAEKLTKPEEFVAVDTEITTLRNEQKELNDGIIKATTILETIDKDEREIATLREKIDDLNKKELPEITEKMRKVELVKGAFGSKGIETIVIDYLLTSLESKINTILSRLCDFKIHLSTQKKSADMERDIEGLWITVENECGEEMSFENYSGGEKIRLIFAIAEGFSSLSKKRIGFKLIDEAILALDSNSLETFLEAVQEILEGTNQVLFISHIQDIKDLFDKSIIVTKHNGISKI